MAGFSTDVNNREQAAQWIASLPPDAQKAWMQYASMDAARQNYLSSKESGGRTTEALARKTYLRGGGDAGYQAAKENLQQSYPDVYKTGESLRQAVPGLGGGGNELVAFAAFLSGMGLAGAAGAAAGGGAAGGAASAAGGAGATGAGAGAFGTTAGTAGTGTLVGEAAGGTVGLGASGLGTGAGATGATTGGIVGSGGMTAAEAGMMGVGGSNALSSLGGGSSTTPSSAGGYLDSAGNWVSDNQSGLSSLLQGGASLWAGEQGAQAADKATAELRRQFDIGQANTQPWLQAGQKALGAQQDLMGLGAGGPEAQLSSLMASPGYQFRLGQGRRNLEASSAARGGMGSGKAGTAMQQYGQEFASNEYGNRLNQLAGLSGTGQTQAAQSMQAGMGYAGDIGSASLAGSQARQSGILGAGTALSNWMNPQPKQPTLADLLRGQ